MTTAAERVVIELVSYAHTAATDEELMSRIDDAIDSEHRNLVDALVLVIVSLIDHGGADTWGGIVARLALDDA